LIATNGFNNQASAGWTTYGTLYPTAIEFHYPSPDLPAGRDMFGAVLREAHARKIRVVGRFDLSKTRKAVFDAHPEWFFRQANGEPVIYNGLYSACINGGYYREQGMKILSEALDKYAVDGLFFNMFGNQSRDYSGREVGLCHCDACAKKYRETYHKEIPDRPDDDYRKFMFTSSREVAAAIGELIRSKRPQAGYFNYIQEYTDGIMSESNTAVARPLPLWPYAASDNVNRARNSQPGKMAVDLNMQFVDWLGKREFDLVIATDWAPEGLKQYVENGGQVLIVGAHEPEFEVAPVVKTINEIRGYVRVRDHAAFPSLKDTDLLMLNGPFTELRDDGPALLTLVPPSMFGPPEFIHIDMKDTDTTAIVFRRLGKGTVAWIPWNLGGM
jgi:hypothetical protein